MPRDALDLSGKQEHDLDPVVADPVVVEPVVLVPVVAEPVVVDGLSTLFRVTATFLSGEMRMLLAESPSFLEDRLCSLAERQCYSGKHLVQHHAP